MKNKLIRLTIILLLSILISYVTTITFGHRLITIIEGDIKITSMFESTNPGKYQNYFYDAIPDVIYNSKINILLNFSLFFIIYFMLIKILHNKKNNLLNCLIPFLMLIYILRIDSLLQIFLCFGFYVSYFICNKNKNNFPIIIISLYLLFLSIIFIEKINFQMLETSFEFLHIFVHMTFYTVILYGIRFITLLKENYKNPFYKKWIKYTLIYLVINIIVLLLIYPGNFIHDEKDILDCAEKFVYSGWQSYLMVLFYSWSLLIIPYVVGIELFQIIIISFIIGYILAKIEIMYKSKTLNIVLLILLSFPPILMNNLYPLRHAILCYVELLFLFKIFELYKTKATINFLEMSIFAFCIILISFWRTENIYYILLGPLFVIILFKKQMLNKKSIFKFISLIIIFWLMYFPLQVLNKKYPNIYTLTAFANPLSMMFQEEDLKISKEEYDAINNVLKVEVLKEHPSHVEIPAFSYNLVQLDYKEHMDKFTKNYVKLILKNPIIFLNARMKTLIATSGLEKNAVANSPWGIYSPTPNPEDVTMMNMINHDKISKALNLEFRDKMIRLFKGVESDSYIYTTYGMVIWNFMPMLMTISAYLIYSLFKKNKSIIFITLLCLGKVPLIFATAPANYFFYYFSIYLCGMFFIAYTIFLIKKWSEKKWIN